MNRAAGISLFIPRPNEHERIVADLLDQRFFSPVAISTSLGDARGMGKASLAREICRDQRVVDAFPDGIVWVTVGKGLSPLQLLSRIERLIYDLSGEQRGLTELDAAENHLRSLVHPRQMLLVLDECYDAQSVNPFLQTGPGGGVLLIGRDAAALPPDARSTPVDIMGAGEAAALLAFDLARADSPGEDVHPPEPMPFHAPGEDESSAALPREQRAMRFFQDEIGAHAPQHPLVNQVEVVEPAAYYETDQFPADPILEAALRGAEQMYRRITDPLGERAIGLLTQLAGRLNEWPILLTLVNGYLRARLQTDQAEKGASPEDVIHGAAQLLQKNGLNETWAIDNLLQRQKAINAVMETCLDPLPEEIRQRFYALVVFPLEEEIPLAAVSALWGCSSEETFPIAERLARHELISLDPAAWTIHLHPLVDEYISDHLRVGVVADLHRGLVAGYAGRCKCNPHQAGISCWASGPDDGYFFQHLGSHMAAAGQRDELQSLLFNFKWLLAYLTCTNLLTGRRGDLYSLLLDFELALTVALERQSADLRLVREALRMAAPILIRDPNQLSTQLLGRLLPFEEPEVRALLRQAERWTGEAWLRPVSACFRLPDGCDVRTIRGHADWITGLALLPDGQRAVSGALDGALCWWDLATGQNLHSILAHPSGISALAITPDGRKVITASWEGGIRVWEETGAELLLEFAAHPEAVGALAVTPDGNRLVTASDDQLIRVWDLASGKLQLELIGHSDPVRALAVSADGHTLLSGSWDTTVRAWDLDDGSQMDHFSGHTAWVSAVAFLPGGNQCVSAGWDRTIRLWDLETGEIAKVVGGFKHIVLSLAITPSGSRVVAGLADGSVRLMDAASGETLQELSGHSSGVNQIALTQGGRYAVSASNDRSLRVWDLLAIQPAREQSGHAAPVFALQALPDGERGISASWDGTLKVWDLASGAAVRELSGHMAGVVALAVSADGRICVSGSRDHTLKVWDLASGEELRTLPGHAGTITTVALTPDGEHAISGADDGTVKVWQLSRGICLAEFRGEGAIWSCAVAKDGKTIVASESSGKMYFLEIISGESAFERQ